jgi:anthranilate synthase component 1
LITELEFKSLAQAGYNRIPLIAEAFADLETPLSLYLKLAHAKGGGQLQLSARIRGGRRALWPLQLHRPAGAHAGAFASGFGADAVTEVVRDGKVVETSPGNPLDFIADYQKRFKVALRPGLPRFCGGLAGYFGYDTVRHIEKKLEKHLPARHAGLPRHPAAAV